MKGQLNKGAVGRRASFMRADTLVTKFKTQLSSLMETIGRTDVQYVRCVKPNSVKSKNVFDRHMVVEQLRCSGMIEAIRITRAAYPYRVLQSEFLKRFKPLKSPAFHRNFAKKSEKEHCLGLLQGCVPQFAGLQDKSYEIGLTKVYFSAGVLEALESLRSGLIMLHLTTIQRTYRGYTVRVQFRRMKCAAVSIQSFARMLVQRIRFIRFVKSVTILQAHVRQKIAFRRCKHLRQLNSIIMLQALFRMLPKRGRYLKIRRAATTVGRKVRWFLNRVWYRRAQAEKKEQAKLSNQLDILMKKLKQEAELR